MNASMIVLLALGAAMIGKWSNNKKITGRAVAEGAFVLLFLTILDAGPARSIARGLAWIIFASVLLGNSSPLTGLTKSTGNASNAAAVKGTVR